MGRIEQMGVKGKRRKYVKGRKVKGERKRWEWEVESRWE